MEFLSQFLPIIIYILLIVIIVVGIVLGIKLIITIDKVSQMVDDINAKIEKVTPLFNIMGVVSDSVNSVVGGVVGTIENFVGNLFRKRNKKRLEESDDDE